MSNSTQIFCPRCATRNDIDQSYCRQCGLALSGIQSVLEGKIIESRSQLLAADKWIRASNSILIAFISIAVTISILSIVLGHPVLSAIAMINVLTGALIGFPFSIVGKRKLTKALRLMAPTETTHHLTTSVASSQHLQGNEPAKLPSTAPDSITEHTTLHLTKPDS